MPATKKTLTQIFKLFQYIPTSDWSSECSRWIQPHTGLAATQCIDNKDLITHFKFITATRSLTIWSKSYWSFCKFHLLVSNHLGATESKSLQLVKAT